MSKEAAFSVFCLENYKAYKSLTGKQTAELFRQYGVFDYLNEFYDVLHTTGYQYINHDIDIYLKSRNAVITANRFIIYQVVSLLSVSRSDSQWQFNIRVKIGEIFFHNECFCFMVLQI